MIRSVETIKGLEIMKANRGVKDIKNSNGPGKLTRTPKVDKCLNSAELTSSKSPIFIIAAGRPVHLIGESSQNRRKKDLDEELRFYIKGDCFISRRQ